MDLNGPWGFEHTHCTLLLTGNIITFVFYVHTHCEEGRKHGASMLTESGLLRQLQQNALSPAGQPMCIYGDPAYPLRVHLQDPFKNAHLTRQMQQFNKCMSEEFLTEGFLRVSVEWLFNDNINNFKLIHGLKKKLKAGLSSVLGENVHCISNSSMLLQAYKARLQG